MAVKIRVEIDDQTQAGLDSVNRRIANSIRESSDAASQSASQAAPRYTLGPSGSAAPRYTLGSAGPQVIYAQAAPAPQAPEHHGLIYRGAELYGLSHVARYALSETYRTRAHQLAAGAASHIGEAVHDLRTGGATRIANAAGNAMTAGVRGAGSAIAGAGNALKSLGESALQSTRQLVRSSRTLTVLSRGLSTAAKASVGLTAAAAGVAGVTIALGAAFVRTLTPGGIAARAAVYSLGKSVNFLAEHGSRSAQQLQGAISSVRAKIETETKLATDALTRLTDIGIKKLVAGVDELFEVVRADTPEAAARRKKVTEESSRIGALTRSAHETDSAAAAAARSGATLGMLTSEAEGRALTHRLTSYDRLTDSREIGKRLAGARSALAAHLEHAPDESSLVQARKHLAEGRAERDKALGGKDSNAIAAANRAVELQIANVRRLEEAQAAYHARTNALIEETRKLQERAEKAPEELAAKADQEATERAEARKQQLADLMQLQSLMDAHDIDANRYLANQEKSAFHRKIDDELKSRELLRQRNDLTDELRKKSEDKERQYYSRIRDLIEQEKAEALAAAEKIADARDRAAARENANHAARMAHLAEDAARQQQLAQQQQQQAQQQQQQTLAKIDTVRSGIRQGLGGPGAGLLGGLQAAIAPDALRRQMLANRLGDVDAQSAAGRRIARQFRSDQAHPQAASEREYRQQMRDLMRRRTQMSRPDFVAQRDALREQRGTLGQDRAQAERDKAMNDLVQKSGKALAQSGKLGGETLRVLQDALAAQQQQFEQQQAIQQSLQGVSNGFKVLIKQLNGARARAQGGGLQ